MANLLDIDVGLEYCADDEDVYCEIVEMFCDSMEESKEAILSSKADKEWKEYTTHVHALKSSALTIGAVTLSEAAKELEFAAKEASEQSLALIEEKTGPLLEMYEETVKEALDYLNE